jgi:disulfide bond formation protein DsbB
MKPISKDPSPVSLSISIYGVLLAAYPSGFRHEYGPHMVQVFRDICLRSYTLNGLPGMLDLWTLTLLDYFKSVIEEYLQKGIHMSKSTFIRLSGWSLIVGAISLMVVIAAFSRDVPEYNPYNALSKPIDLYFEYAVTILLPTSMFLWLIGMIGLYQRYSPETNSFGKFSLILGIIGGGIGLLITLSWVLQLEFTQSDADFAVFVGGLSLYFLGLIFFGVVSIRDHLLPRWNALPIITGSWLFLVLLINILELENLFQKVLGPDLFQILLYAVSLSSMLSLVALGVNLKSDTNEEAALA